MENLHGPDYQTNRHGRASDSAYRQSILASHISSRPTSQSTRYFPMGPRRRRLPLDVRSQLCLVKYPCRWLSLYWDLRTFVVWLLGLWALCRLRLDVAYLRRPSGRPHCDARALQLSIIATTNYNDAALIASRYGGQLFLNRH